MDKHQTYIYVAHLHIYNLRTNTYIATYNMHTSTSTKSVAGQHIPAVFTMWMRLNQGNINIDKYEMYGWHKFSSVCSPYSLLEGNNSMVQRYKLQA